MAAAEENSSFFLIFILTMVSLLLVPYTILRLCRAAMVKAKTIHCRCFGCHRSGKYRKSIYKRLSLDFYSIQQDLEISVHGEAGNTMDSVESVVVKTGGDQEMKDCYNIVKDETKIATDDLSCSKAWLTHCPKLRFIHHPSSFSLELQFWYMSILLLSVLSSMTMALPLDQKSCPRPKFYLNFLVVVSHITETVHYLFYRALPRLNGW